MESTNSKRRFCRLYLTICVLFLAGVLSVSAQQGQRGQQSEVLVTYDFTSPESKTEIPFDKYFTFQILHFNTEKINQIKVYQAVFREGKRDLKIDYIENGNFKTAFDFEITDFKIKHDTLLLYFPPIKPDKEFEIVVKRGLTGKNLQTAFDLNMAIIKNSADTAKLFKKLKYGVIDTVLNLSAIKIKTYPDYYKEFTNKFVTYYNHLRTPTNYPAVPFLSMSDLNLLADGFTKKGLKFNWGYVPVRLIYENKLGDMFGGFLPADFDSNTKNADTVDYKGRVANLSKSINMMDTIYRYLNTYLFKDDYPTYRSFRATMQNTIDQLKKNKAFINKEITTLTDTIQSDSNLEEIEAIVGGTRAKDIKTQGTNIFTLDLGLATIGSWNSRNQFAILPKLYYGVNIYFRPINKNTRRENLPSGLKANYRKGPDYNIVAQESIWQHLSLTIGFTTGGYRNTEFDNLYNNTTLLIGPGYRFYRAFKVTAGAAFLRRTSNNPVITDKGLFVGPFLSFSADIDLVQTIKDLITPLWK